VIPVLRYSALEATHTSFCRIALQVHHKYAGKYKWLLLAEDSSFVLVENARFYVAPLDHSKPYYLGRPEQKYGSPPYNAPDSTILLSAGAFDQLVDTYKKNDNCGKSSLLNGTLQVSRSYEVSMGIIFNSLNNDTESIGGPQDTRDGEGKSRFLAFAPKNHLIPGLISIFNSFWRKNVVPIGEGSDCCSDHAISFHGLTPTQMYLTEYLLYHLSIFDDSPLGLGNQKPKYSRNAKSYSAFGNDVEVGTPVIKFINDKLDDQSINTKASNDNFF